LINQKKYPNLIFIADDDEDDLSFILSALQDSAPYCTFRSFPHGKELIDNLNSSDLPSLVILDLNMPILNGNETLSYMKQHQLYKCIPVVILSTSNHPLERQMCLKSGAAKYLSKPTSVQDYKKIANDVLKTYIDSDMFVSYPAFPAS
jgi:CheY-like chemotaxis protein